MQIHETNATAEALSDTIADYQRFVEEFRPFVTNLLSLEEEHRVGEQGGLYWPMLKLLQSVANGGERQVIDAGTRRAKTAREIREIFRAADAPGMEIPVNRIQAKAEFVERLDFQESFGRALRDAFARGYEELTGENWTPYKPAPQTKQSSAEQEALKAWALAAIGQDHPVVIPTEADEPEAPTTFDETEVGMERSGGGLMEERG